MPLLMLNDRWRVVHDGQLQWALQVRKGEEWKGRRFHQQRDALLLSIRELCEDVAPAALKVIRAWPARYDPAHAACIAAAPGGRGPDDVPARPGEAPERRAA